ncbi:MAG TPA: hypothetical protein VII11_07545 [Bacteroidota bacterium]
MIVVVPSSRSITLEYVEPLIASGARFIIVDDSEGSIVIDHPQFEVYNWNDQRRMLGDLQRAIPRRNGACRDFGFYVAWKNSEPGEIIITLDDDEIAGKSFAADVERTLENRTRRVASGAGKHFNIFDCYQNVEKNLYPRGFPYSARTEHAPWGFEQQVSCDVAFNLGLWTNIFDINAIDKLQGPRYTYPDAELRHPSVLVPHGAMVSVCAGNMQFRRELIPAVYQLLMHVEVMPGWVIDRYGDIWGGFILKTLMDRKGDRMAVGAPMIHHLKEGSFQRNIWQEHLCHLVNDEFLALLDRARDEVAPGDYRVMMEQLAEIFAREREGCSAILRRYFDHLLPAMKAWVKALSL